MFLLDSDYEILVHPADLAIIQRSTPELRQKAEATAIEQMKDYLRGRYDVEAIFSAPPENRNLSLVMHLVDMVIYHLLASTPGEFVTETRETRYKLALQWLKDINAGKLNPDLPYKDQQDTGNTIRYKKSEKYENYW